MQNSYKSVPKRGGSQLCTSVHMVKYDAIDVRFGEIALKGRNRGEFVRLLVSNIYDALKGERYSALNNIHDRIMIRLSKDSDLESILEKLGYVFGVAWFAPVLIAQNKIESILTKSKPLIKKNSTLRIEPSRAYKEVPFKSEEISRAFIENSDKLRFHPEKDSENKLYVNVTQEGTFIFNDRRKGLGGLPVGSSGNAVVLLSGGIDSPVASFYAMKRGLRLSYLHMHMFSNAEEASESKMGEILKILSRYSPGKPSVYYAPSHIFQSYVLKAKHGYDLILLKRFLYKLAEKVAEKELANALVTGESVGQVASQTITNLISAESGCKLFVMRPLSGFDKQEIVDMAKKLGTFEISIKSYKDVCSINSKNPPTVTDYRKINTMFKEVSLDKALTATLKKTVKL